MGGTARPQGQSSGRWQSGSQLALARPIVALKRVKLDAKAERELHMLTMLSNLSDVPRLRCWPGVFSCFGSQPGAALHLHTPAYLPCPRLLCFLCLFSRTH